MAAAAAADLGDDLVVQTPYGDSGRTTFFIHGERDWAKAAKAVTGEDEVKVMRRVNVKAAAIEATITRHGTIVGPLMTDLTGYRELTPYKGGWCGNDIFPDALPAAQRNRARDLTEKLGARLAQEGYRGFFEVDFLADRVIALDALNPQVAARMARGFDRWRKFDASRQARARAALERIRDAQGLSRDVAEIVTKALG